MLRMCATLLLTGSAMLFAAACSSNQSTKPYGLTGEPSWNDELRERQRWIDDKGRYRSDWRHGHAAAPHGYPKPLPR
jgi:hypothetical protein